MVVVDDLSFPLGVFRGKGSVLAIQLKIEQLVLDYDNPRITTSLN